MVQPTQMSELDRWLDKYYGVNPQPPPKLDRVLPTTFFLTGLAAIAVEAVGFSSAPGSFFAFAVLLMVPAIAIGWGLGGLQRPYKRVPNPGVVTVVGVRRMANGRIRQPMSVVGALIHIAIGLAMLVWTYLNRMDGPVYFFLVADMAVCTSGLIGSLIEEIDARRRAP